MLEAVSPLFAPLSTRRLRGQKQLGNDTSISYLIRRFSCLDWLPIIQAPCCSGVPKHGQRLPEGKLMRLARQTVTENIGHTVALC